MEIEPLLAWNLQDLREGSLLWASSCGSMRGQTVGRARLVSVAPLSGAWQETCVAVGPVFGCLSLIGTRPGSRGLKPRVKAGGQQLLLGMRVWGPTA